MKITSMLILRFTLVLGSAMWAACDTKAPAASGDTQPVSNDLYSGVEFDMPRVSEPGFPAYSVSITEYGAVPGGTAMNTKAFADAIDVVSRKGGGRVIIPPGIWLTGPVTLKSNINLHTEKGALVIFSSDFDDYPLVETSFEGLNTWRCASPINGRDLENVAITGSGVFDGSGDAWRPVKRSKVTSGHWKKLVGSGGVVNERGDIWYPSEAALKGAENSEMNVPNLETKEAHQAIRDFLRPVMVSLVRCKKVLLDGPTFQNSPAWCLHPLMCEDVTIRNVTVKNPWYSQNGDGLDLESCKNAIIHNSSFDVGDDAICIKSGKGKEGRARGIPAENTIIRDCIVYHGHGGFTVGSEMSGGVRNIHVSGLTFIGTDVGLRFKSTRGRGGIVENIHISDINMIDIPAEAILFDLYYTGNSPIPEGDEKVTTEDKERMAMMTPAVTEETPSFRNIFMKNIVCKGAGRAVLFQGLPEMNLKNISLENVRIEATKGLYSTDADGISMKNIVITASEGPALFFYNSKNVRIDSASFGDSPSPVIRVDGSLTNNIHILNTAPLENDTKVRMSAEVAEDAVTIEP